MAAALECWSGRPSTDEDMVEQVLMKTHDRSEAFPSSSAAPTTNSSSAALPPSSVPPKKWQRLGRNLAGAISALKNSLNLDALRDQIASARTSGPKEKLLWGGVVLNLTQLYPGSQLPEKLIASIRRHFESLPNSYAQAGHDMKEVLLHVRLVEQATDEDHPAVHVQELEELSGTDGALFRLTFASTTPISWASVSGALDTSSISCKKIQIYERRGLTLGVVTLLVHHGGENLFKARVDAAVRSAVKKPKNGSVKLHFGLCGCQENEGTRKEEHRNHDADGDSTGSEKEKETLPNPLPESSLVVSIDEWQSIRSGGEEIGRWLLSSNQIEIVDRTGPNSFKGVYKGKKVWVKKLRGCERGRAYEIEVKRDLLELMSHGHRNLLHLHGLCIEEAQGLCLVSRMMEGGSVHDLLCRNKKIPTREVFNIARCVAEGLMFMNDHGVAYRDLNARRILLDKHGNACLGDMGTVIVCHNAAEATEYETAGYRWLAPEIIAGDPETVKETWMSNVYSLGMVVWEMVTGEAAYGSYSPVQVAVGIAACGLRPEIPNECPQVLRSLMVRCWSNNPCKRPRLSEVVAILLKNTSR